MSSNPPPRRSWLRALGTFTLCVGILGGAVAAVVVINRTEPTAKKSKATRKSAALVDTVVVHRGTYSPRLVVLGSVQPAQDITLSPRVAGQIVEVAESFVPGGRVAAGELLLRIDPADFENTLAERQSQLRQAQAAQRIEEGRQVMARKELSLLEGTIGKTNRSLVLREPQFDSVEAEVQVAEAAVERAELSLGRTRVLAPFDAQILTQAVNLGSQVSPGDELARLVGTEEYWVSASVPVRHLQWIRFPKDGRPGSRVVLRNPDTWVDGQSRGGEVLRLIGALDQRTRLARVLISVRDPLADNLNAPPLILDSLVETEIEGRPIEGVVRLARESVRDGGTVWVMQDGALAIRSPEIVFQDPTHAYIRAGLGDGDEVVTSTLATVAEGVGLRRREPIAASESDADEPAGVDQADEALGEAAPDAGADA